MGTGVSNMVTLLAPKLTLKWNWPAEIKESNDTNACILIPNGKTKVTKTFFSSKNSSQTEQIQSDKSEQLDFPVSAIHSHPTTKGTKKILDHISAAQ